MIKLILLIKKQRKMRQGRISKKTGYKKAMITLKKGQTIDLTASIMALKKNFQTLHKIK